MQKVYSGKQIYISQKSLKVISTLTQHVQTSITTKQVFDAILKHPSFLGRVFGSPSLTSRCLVTSLFRNYSYSLSIKKLFCII